ncbi:Ribonuclease H-like domain [Phytophthora cactorum]|nr:Ribonuclease H-like domain [Phytophthora cactorum]KAF1789821.1 Ribonuclease H-like domain [Phytophthora cactorum]
MDVGFVPPTSKECDRFFSAARLVLADLRKSMEPERLEAVMSLSINREL